MTTGEPVRVRKKFKRGPGPVRSLISFDESDERWSSFEMIRFTELQLLDGAANYLAHNALLGVNE